MLERCVGLWIDTEPSGRATLFGTASHARHVEQVETRTPDALLPSLRGVLALVEHPTKVSAKSVAQACAGVSKWADAAGYPRTALVWAELAARANPNDARAAYAAGVLARRRAEYMVAEVWFQAATTTAYRRRDWPSFVMALIATGNMHAQRGQYQKAEETLQRALKSARRPPLKSGKRGIRAQLRDMERRTLHDLMTVQMHTARYAAAERFAREGYELMKPAHPHMPAFAHDVGYLWLSQGDFARALPVFRALLPLLTEPSHRIRCLTNLARAAGACGDALAFELAHQATWDLAASMDAIAIPAASLTSLARGAASLRRWEDAERASRRALEIAKARREDDQMHEAVALMEAINLRSAAESVCGRSGHADATLSTDLVSSLEQMAGA